MPWHKDAAGRSFKAGSRRRSAPSGPPPLVQGVDPALGSAGGPIEIQGSGFTGATRVEFVGSKGTVAAAPFTVTSDQRINTTIPDAGASGEGALIAVTNPAGTGSMPDAFWYA